MGAFAHSIRTAMSVELSTFFLGVFFLGGGWLKIPIECFCKTLLTPCLPNDVQKRHLSFREFCQMTFLNVITINFKFLSKNDVADLESCIAGDFTNNIVSSFD